MPNNSSKKATLYRMVTKDHICPYGLKARDLLQRQGFAVEDKWLTTREETDAFKAEHGVKTTPQVFINGQRIGGYEVLRRYFGTKIPDPKALTYRPVIAIFVVTALMAMATSYAAIGHVFSARTVQWFIAFSMAVLAILKLQNLESFSTMFLNYDLLAKRWVPYGYIYPFAEAGAGVLMIAGAFNWISIPVALFIGTIGAVSVFKAVYIDKRELKCACVGGGNNVPLGFVSLTENMMMVAMAVWMLAMAFPLGNRSHTTHGMHAQSAYMTGMEKMQRNMNVSMTDDADQDFVAMMIPHHQGAIDMANVELKFGRDPTLRQMSENIIAAQNKEIAEIKAWQSKNLHTK